MWGWQGTSPGTPTPMLWVPAPITHPGEDHLPDGGARSGALLAYVSSLPPYAGTHL